MLNKLRKKNKKTRLDFDLRRLDSDGDGLTDYEEINIYGTDPHNPDTDRDGMSDYEEIKRGRNPKGPGSLKDLFIPYIGNNYQPTILHPQRLFFYSLSVILVQFIVIVFVSLFPISAWLTPDILAQESKKVIELTNEIRQKVSASLLKENQLLDQAAYKKAQDMLVQQYFAHVGPNGKDLADWITTSGYKYDIAGENLAMGFANAADVVNAWTKSPTHYSNLVDPDFVDIGVSMVSGPFNGHDTTLVAQYFAYSSQPNVAPVASVKLETAIQVPAEGTTTPVVKTSILPAKEENQPGIENQEPIKPPVPPAAPKPETNVNIAKPTPTPVSAPVKETEVAAAKENLQVPADSLINESIPTTPIKEEPNQKNNQATKESLALPTLIFPQDNYLSQTKESQLIVYAPQAEQVLVFNGENEIARKDSLMSDFFDFTVSLETGKNLLRFKAVKQNEQKFSANYVIEVDDQGPAIDLNKSKLAIIQPAGQEEKIVNAVAYLGEETTKAEIYFGDYEINLEKSEEGLDGFNKWTGQLIIFRDDERKIFNTIILPVIKAWDEFGHQTTADITWDNIIPLRPSLVKQYFFIKSHPLENVNLLFSVESWFYQIILVVAIVALLLNIFIEIKRQYPRIILSALGFIFLLVILIVI